MKDTSKVHVGYIIGILIVINITTMTVRLGQSSELVAYISFAATLASLILAVLAIVYSYLSSGSVASFTEKIAEAQTKLDEASSTITEATNNLEEIASALPQAVKILDEKVTKTHDMLANLSSAATNKKVEESESPNLEETVSLTRLAFGSSPQGLLCLHLACEAYISKKHFKLKDIASNGFFLDEYSYGWLMALDAAAIIDARVKSENWTIDKIPDNFIETVDLAITDRIESTRNNEKTKKWADSYEAAVKHIKEFFAKEGENG